MRYGTRSKPVTRHCDECVHFAETPGWQDVVPCGAGHRPRFYMPQHPQDNGWGWKRACDDYQLLKQSEAER